ncbi:blue light sensor protein [Acinetobacter sp. Ag2]|uniref:BLUF domain-containing protein n=1 Tax=Acinetobacter TaxID=469 RepID=UPI0006299AB6|nr:MULTISPECIES: BLUF domain-containing protein [Acinetobacter]KKW81575.1 blue light sensor protein [Acinetobacter sp. Ag2]MCU4417097.1 BLUF domain-containing protein [Acinetobacter bereziniae]
MLIRLCYASSRNQLTSDLLEDLNNILNTAREFNSNNQIFGVLYYANNYFFQCLEGDKAIVQTLFQQIKNDLRHHDIVEFKIKQIDKIYFKNWSMKYVQKCSKIDIFFNQMGYELFTPTALNEDNLDIFLKELLSEKQTRMRKKVGLNQRGVSTFL